MEQSRDRAFPESVDDAGRVILSHHHLALLHGLLDRPDGVAHSTADWVRAALPYAELFRRWASTSLLRAATHTVHSSWVGHERVGRRHRWTLMPRGLAIIELRTPAVIRRLGAYEGLAPHRSRAVGEWSGRSKELSAADRAHIAARLRDASTRWWIAATADKEREGLVFAISRIAKAHYLSRLRMSTNERNFAMAKAGAVRLYLCRNVMDHGELPRGKKTLDGWSEHVSGSFEVDFDNPNAAPNEL